MLATGGIAIDITGIDLLQIDGFQPSIFKRIAKAPAPISRRGRCRPGLVKGCMCTPATIADIFKTPPYIVFFPMFTRKGLPSKNGAGPSKSYKLRWIRIDNGLSCQSCGDAYGNPGHPLYGYPNAPAHLRWSGSYQTTQCQTG